MRDPPVESWFMVNTSDLGIFGGLNGVGFLEITKVFPEQGAVLPLAAYLPTNGRALKVGPAIGVDYFLVSKSDRRGEAVVVNNLIQQDILVPIRVTLGEEQFRDQVSGELGLVIIVKIDDVRVCVKDRVGIGEPNRVAILVTFACGDVAFDHGTTSWQHDLSSEIIVAHFGGDLSVPIVRVNDMGVVKIDRVRGQVFCLKVICRCRRAEVSNNGLVEVLVFLLVH